MREILSRIRKIWQNIKKKVFVLFEPLINRYIEHRRKKNEPHVYYKNGQRYFELKKDE